MYNDTNENDTRTTEEVIADNIKGNERQWIIGLDPGGTTGVAMVSFTKDETRVEALGQIEDGRFGFLQAFHAVDFGTHIKQYVVSEQWVERNVKGADREPIYIEGVEWALWQDETFWQTPDMKSLVSDEWLKEQGVWTEGKRHQMDALIHALVWLRNQGHMPTIKALMGEMQLQNASGQGEPGEQDGEGGDQGGQGQAGAGTGNVNFSPEFQAAMQKLIDAAEEDDNLFASIAQKVKDSVRRDRELNGAFAGYTEDVSELDRQSTLFEGKL